MSGKKADEEKPGEQEEFLPSQELTGNRAANLDDADSELHNGSATPRSDSLEIQMDEKSSARELAPAVQPGTIAVPGQSDGRRSIIVPAAPADEGAVILEPLMTTTDEPLGKTRASFGQAIQPGAVAVRGTHGNTESDIDPAPIRHQDCSPSVASLPVDGIRQNQGATAAQGSFRENEPMEADEDLSPPMIEAELVTAPIIALHVAIDEENTVTSNPYRQPLEMDHMSESGGSTRPKQYSPTFWALLAMLGIVVLCAVAIPLTLRLEKPRVSHSAAPPRFPYPCYTSTWKILEAQLSDEPTPDAYIICPGTKIKPGTFRNPAVDDYTFVEGDYPIMAVRENVTIQCGLDGKQENRCVLDGGFMQVLTLQKIPLRDRGFFLYNGSIDNLMIRGITFTGIPESVGPFTGQSISLSHPGENIRFVDCLWEDISVEALISVTRDYFQILFNLPLNPRSVEATFEDCTFKNIVYSYPLVTVLQQSATFRRCLFENIKPSAFARGLCGVEELAETTDSAYYGEGCAAFMFADQNSTISMEDNCFENFGTYGPGMVIVHEETAFAHSGLFLGSSDTTCEEAVINNNNPSNITCFDIFDAASCRIHVQ